MTVAIGNRNVSVGTIVAIAGGVLAVVGAFLAWETISEQLAAFTGEGSSISGWALGNGGKILAVLGVIAVGIGIADVMNAKLPVGSAAALTVVGVLALGVAVLNFGAVSKDVNDANTILANAGGMGVGLYLDILASVAILAGGVLGLVGKKS